MTFGAVPLAETPLLDVPPLHHLRYFYDPFSAASHLLGAAVFLLLGLLLLRRAGGNGVRRAVLGVYAFACVFLMAVSGVYHMTVTGGAANRVMVRLDHGAIFLLIAGTFTPVHAILFRGPLRWAPLVIIWTVAAGGIVLKTAFTETVAEWVSLTLYLAMGWFGTAAGIVLWRRHGFAFIRPLLFGGIAYSAGAVMDFLRWPAVVVPGVIHAHEVFHVAVLTGAAFHFAFIWGIADPAAISGRMVPIGPRPSIANDQGDAAAAAVMDGAAGGS
jgi:channel protein (hemolysin III family)